MALKVYSVVVFYHPEANRPPSKYRKVTKLFSLARWLDANHPAWVYFNIYDRSLPKGRNYLRRHYRGNFLPQQLH